MTIIAALVFASSIASDIGEQDEFMSLPQQLVGAEVGVIPGSYGFYKPLMFPDGRTWTVTSNGVSVVSANADLGPVSPPSEYANRYNAAYDANGVIGATGGSPSPSTGGYREWSPSLFDYAETATSAGGSYNLRFRWNGDGSNVYSSVFYGDGTELYQPRSVRFTSDNFTALVSSYSAYYERLYYASEGQTSAWNTNDWGTAEKSPSFKFNVTNASYSASCYFDKDAANASPRAIESTRKLTQWDNLRRLRENLRESVAFAPAESTETPCVSPSFVYRPGWFLDHDTVPEWASTNALMWWASQSLPPTVYHEFGSGVVQDPVTDGFGFFPTFSWTASPVGRYVSGRIVQTFDWATKCVTIDAAGNPSADNPCRAIFASLGYDIDTPLSETIHPYYFGVGGNVNRYRWLTNAFPRCVSQFYDRDAAFGDYVARCWGNTGEAPTRRLEPNDYTGVNQMLALMDRTIMIPAMTVESTNINGSVERTGNYREQPRSFTFSVSREGDVVVSFQTTGTVQMGLADSTNVVEESENGGGQLPAMSSSEVFSYVYGSGGAGVGVGNAIFDEHFIATYGEDGTHVIELTGVDGIAGTDVAKAFIVHFTDEDGAARDGWADAATTDATGTMSLFARLYRYYYYSRSEAIRVNMGPTQPGVSGWSRVSSTKARTLVREDVGVWQSGSILPQYSFLKWASFADDDYSSRSALVGSVSARISAAYEDMVDQCAEAIGYDYRKPAEYAPLPPSVLADYEVTTNGISRFTAEPVGFGRHTFTNDVWYKFANVTNQYVYTATRSREDRVDEFSLYDVERTTYAATGLVVSNRIARGIEYGPTATTVTTNIVYARTVERAGTYLSGPWPQKLAWAENVNYDQDADEWWNRLLAVTNKIDRNAVHDVMMSGSGPDDPGEKSGETYSTNDVPVSSSRTESTAFDRVDELDPVAFATMADTRLALEVIGGEVTVYGMPRVEYEKDGETVSVTSSTITYKNPLTGETVTEQWGFPFLLGVVNYTLDFEADVTTDTESLDGCKVSSSCSMDAKTMTEVNWRWTNMRAD